MDQKIRTYMVIYDDENIRIGLNPVQTCFYEIEQFTPSNVRYNQYTFTLENNDISVVLKNPFLTKDVCDIFEKGRKLNIAIVKFWGNVSQEFKYVGSFLLSVDFGGLILSFKFDQCAFSEKNADNKHFTKLLIPMIREEKLNTLLDD